MRSNGHTSQLAMAQGLQQRRQPRSVGAVVERPVAAARGLGVVIQRPGRLLPGRLGQVGHIFLGRGAVVELKGMEWEAAVGCGQKARAGRGQGRRWEQGGTAPLASFPPAQPTLLCLISSRMASREPGAALNAGHFIVTGAGSCWPAGGGGQRRRGLTQSWPTGEALADQAVGRSSRLVDGSASERSPAVLLAGMAAGAAGGAAAGHSRRQLLRRVPPAAMAAQEADLRARLI